MASIDDYLVNLYAESDISPVTDLYRELLQSFAGIVANLAFFVFQKAENSHSARQLEDGSTASCPAFDLFLKYNADLRATGIDLHPGNWDDKWKQTVAVRNAANAIFASHKFGSNWVSPRTFIFLDTLERIFWDGRQYYLHMTTKDGYKRIKRAQERVVAIIAKVLAKADVHQYCQHYDVSVAFGYGDANLFHHIREDIE